MKKQDSPSLFTESNSSDTTEISKVVVYCASSPHIDDIYFETADTLGKLLAENNIECITGAGKQGLMGAVNTSVIKNNGKVTGVIPRFMVDKGWYHPNLTEMIVTETMHERKQQMAQMSHAAIALPGGLGTLEELAEILTWRQLELYNKPIVIMNTNHYYDPLISMFEQMIDHNFMHDSYRNMWYVATTPQDAINYLKNYTAWIPTITKYDKKEL